MIPEQIKQFIEVFSRLPTIGPRMATRLAFHFASLDKKDIERFENSLAELKEMQRCERCFFWGEGELCTICMNPVRSPRMVAIVERETDLLSIEKTRAFKGIYLVLGELSRRETLTDEQKKRLASLKAHIAKDYGGEIDEIVIALGLHTLGDFASDMIAQGFKGMAKKITRLGRGIPTGGEVEFADEETLKNALETRR